MRGAQHNPHNKFAAHREVFVPELQDQVQAAETRGLDGGEEAYAKTKYIPTHPKSILNKISSPDVPGEWGLNPYQGCEHGCAYCFARNTHNYWGYSAGKDFEQVILVKRNAVALLDEAFTKPSWQAKPIMLSGNTDCYQPIERKERITRGILELCLKYKHPIGILTKNQLITRDLDLLAELAKDQLVHAALSITTLDESLRRLLEPRTASVQQRFKTIKRLTSAGVPVRVMIAPIIPGLTDHEVLPIAQRAAAAGALGMGSTVVRLNGDIAEIFNAWLEEHLPDRAEKVRNAIKSCHRGQLNNSRFGERQRGSGTFAEHIALQVKLARKRFFPNAMPAYNTTLFDQYRPGQRSFIF